MFEENNTNQNINFKFWDIVWSFFWFVLIGLLVLRFVVYQQVTVIGPSMEPSYHTGEFLIVDQLNKSNLQRGQVVAVYEDKEVARTANYFTRFRARFYLKRVIGLPGEEIEMVGSKVIIYNSQYPQGTVLDERYVSEFVKQSEDNSKFYYKRTKVSEKSYFLLGDNRINSTDSRIKGEFPDYTIFGKEVFRFWPINGANEIFYDLGPNDKFRLFRLPDYKYDSLNDDIRAKIQTAEQQSNNYQVVLY